MAKLSRRSALSMFVTTGRRAMTAPATPKPLLVMVLVADCTTMSAPCWMGRNRAGVATVESTMSGNP